jgi:hypothetical protein
MRTDKFLVCVALATAVGVPIAGFVGDVTMSQPTTSTGVRVEQRLYQLIRQQSSIADRQFEIEFFVPGVEAFAFTFG